MRLFAAVLACCPLLLVSPASGEQTFPYKAFVTAEDVYVRSGPGQSYYPTDKLKVGQEVEVYRHDPGGWCAIRPVEGSFTWVSGRHLKAAEDNLAVVTDDGVSARVGSRFSDIREVVQVRLQKGEVVEILDPPPRGAGWGENAWFKIAPPSGEFRWVSSKYLDAEYPRDGVRKPHAGRKHADEPAEEAEPVPEAAPEAAATADDSARLKSPRHRSLSPEHYQAELERLELELSVMVVEEPTAWSFDAMRDRVNNLLDQAQTAVERGRARLLANKIARFEDIKQRYDSVAAMRDRTDRSARLLARLRPGDSGEKTRGKLDIDDRFDGVGQLTQVVSPKAGAPRYALTDETGEVRCYVTPAPGVNLYSYVGKQVGLTGTRGYMPEQRASHIMARHITPLEGPMLR